MTKDVLVSISGLHMDMDAQIPGPDEDDVIEVVRSEERRVGKECRSRWSPYH